MSVPSTFTFRRVNPTADSELLHGWFGQDRARYWGMLEASLADVRGSYAAIDASVDYSAVLGVLNGQPVFLLEYYDPAAAAVGEHYPVRLGDTGMHLLVAPTESPIPGFTRRVMAAALEFLFAKPQTERIVVEPDVGNTKIQALNAAAGFEVAADIRLPDKTARLSLCTRAQFEGAREHLRPELWERASRHLVRKAIAEFAHERLLKPERVTDPAADPAEPARYTFCSDDGASEYSFSGIRRGLDHWSVAADSIRRTRQGRPIALNALDFFLECHETLGIGASVLPLYLEEISSTLAGSAFKLGRGSPRAAELVAPDLDAAAFGQRMERAMTEGHPGFVANNGRIGFGRGDYLRYAPETGALVRLVWIAVHRSRAVFTSSKPLSYEAHVLDELGEPALTDFTARLRALALDAKDYLLMPVHPWQWENKLSITFAADIASRLIVHLGVGEDRYQAQQSIRTFFNADRPERCYVKTALSVLNMGFTRGLSAEYMKRTPAINDWLGALVDADPHLQRVGFSILPEIAAIGYHNASFEAAAPTGSPYRTMLAALWRQSPLEVLSPGERVATMASLLHQDESGDSVVTALIAQSGLPPQQWLRGYLRAYLVPLVHCLFAYEIAFMPHGENVILVLDNGAVTRILMKDIAEEIAVMGSRISLPEEVSRVRVSVPTEDQILTIFTDVFDGFLRFLAAILAEEGVLAEDDFWAEVANVITQYQRDAPEFAERFAEHNLFAAEFPRSCLNRLQLRNNRQMVDLSDPSGSLQLAGTLRNPLAPHAP